MEDGCPATDQISENDVIPNIALRRQLIKVFMEPPPRQKKADTVYIQTELIFLPVYDRKVSITLPVHIQSLTARNQHIYQLNIPPPFNQRIRKCLPQRTAFRLGR